MRSRILVGAVFFVAGVTSFASPSCTNAVFDGTPKSSRKFSHLIQKAKQGDQHAQFQLGIAYESGMGVEQNYAEAVRWYRRAADSGHSGAQNNLGSMYGRGLGVSQSDTEAMKWYLRAAAEGHPAAQNNVGFMYATGRAAAGLGEASSNQEQAVKWYRKAALQDYGPAEFNLGFAYFHGAGTPQDFSQAMGWLRKAADHGSGAAAGLLGFAYEHGLGVSQDQSAAAKWYETADREGFADAKRSLVVLDPSAHEANTINVPAVRSESLPGTAGASGLTPNIVTNQQ